MIGFVCPEVRLTVGDCLVISYFHWNRTGFGFFAVGGQPAGVSIDPELALREVTCPELFLSSGIGLDWHFYCLRQTEELDFLEDSWG